MDIERHEGKREVEKFVHGLRNREIVGGPARERRMRHATREGPNRPSFWTYLNVNGCGVARDKRRKKQYITY
eukprot:3452641-Pleurochrysis_carterae.AAC.1